MSKFEINEDGKSGFLHDVVFLYTKFQKPVLKYQSQTEHEYSVDVVMDEDSADEWAEAFKKNPVKAVKTADFEGTYKCEAPFDGKKQYIVKLRAQAQFKNDILDKTTQGVRFRAGEYVPYEWDNRPKVYIPATNGVEDVTATNLVGNGSKGKVAFNITENDFGKFPKITGILVEEMVEFEASGGGSGSAFGAVEGGFKAPEFSPEEIAEEAEEKPAEAPVESVDDDSDPF